ncbi:LytTR family DNA-binding domain-containing protein [Arcicella aquatica]|uniref:LytTR family DNA-binding domain-containing protein n=1 Tax=Arcicella aquatica TaxID=217141 RepID=A0ABU5QQK7_9BACT|nr:LytTR family DNA-binding domain-containing protein [Arcicella aquatica]MEA5259348.1 LytTR family DNA-binding domain-containing protein [Arcicella aquatica]
MIRAIALDDEQPALEIIDFFCSQIAGIELLKTFTKSAEARLYLEEHPVELIFLDINMPAISGIDFFRNIPHEIMVIFTTAFSEYAVEGFELKAIDYLLKPFTLQRFQQATQKAIDLQQFYLQNQQQYLYFKVDYGLVKVFVSDIIFIEGLDNYLKIHLLNQKPLIVRMTMKACLENLSNNQFVRVHRSFIVAIKHIQFVRNKMIFISKETTLPLGNSYEEGFFNIYGK